MNQTKFYGVARTHNGIGEGVYNDWVEVSKFVLDPVTQKPKAGVSFKKFDSHQEAKEFVDSAPGPYWAWRSCKASGIARTVAAAIVVEDGPLDIARRATRKEAKNWLASTPETSQANSAETPIKKQEKSPETKKRARGFEGLQEKQKKLKEEMVRIYTDGACTNNGKRGASAGWGYHVENAPEYDRYGRVLGSQQTNQRAELTAVAEALEGFSKMPGRRVEIVSDSTYAVNCATKWRGTWERNGWSTSSGGPVQNRDLVEKIADLMDRESRQVDFVTVRGHSGNPGNERADRLAQKGATNR